MHLHRVLLPLVWCLSAPALLHAQTLVWNANTETNLAGYRLSYGTQPGTYTNEVDVGNQTQYKPPAGFDWSRTLYFAVRAYNTSGLVSPFSAEVKWTPPVTQISSLTASVSYPVTAGQSVTWTASASNDFYPIEYRFYLNRRGTWILAKDYSTSNTFTWATAGSDVGEPYAVQVWVRRTGSTAAYEAWLSTPTFAVVGVPFELRANVDFPTPAGNQVTWTAHVNAGTTALEYRFLVRNQSSTSWAVFREYAASNQAQWTPPADGMYAVQAQARRVGSTAAFEYNGMTDWLQVAPSALSVTELIADRTSPVSAGTTVTWSARVRGGMSGPIQYQFWVYSARTGWILAQPYGPTHTFAWTPAWTDDGEYTIQVWAKSNGSTSSYEAWRSSAPFGVTPAPLSLTTATLFPAAPGSNIDWTASVADSTANVEYQFWLYSAATSSWTLARQYNVNPTFRWVPTTTGSYAVEVRMRQVGTSTAYDARRWTNTLQISQTPAQVQTLTSNVTLPAAPGTSITWTAAASGGTAGPLQYQFWRYSGGRWTMVQDYSASTTYPWTPTTADIGDHAIQVWVRSAGTTAAYESYKSSGVFSIR